MTEKHVSIPKQLELFSSTQQLNLSEVYEAIPKEVSVNDSSITWKTKNIALPIERTFSLNDRSMIAEIAPAMLKSRGDNEYVTRFPHFRESRIEYAILTLASKEWLQVNYDKHPHGKPSYLLTTSIYRIQKEIVDSINAQQGTNLSPKNCPYNYTEIREALEILKQTNYSVKDSETQKNTYSFNRIKDLYIDERNNLVIELGTMASEYISNGEWNVTDASAILASKTYYTMKLRTLLNMKFRYAGRGGRPYSPSLSYLVEKLNFHQSKRVSETIRHMTDLIESMDEVKGVIVHKVKDGRKVVGARFDIYPSETFVQSIIKNNKLRKRTENYLVDPEQGNVLIEPLESDYSSYHEYQKALQEYKVQKGKILYRNRAT